MCRRGYYDQEHKLHGRECHWNDFGQMVRSIEWVHGQREGETIHYNSDGQKVWMAWWEAGRLVSITRYDVTLGKPIFFYQVQAGVPVPLFLRRAAE